MPQDEIQGRVDAIAARHVPDEMGTARHALLFSPGTYGSPEQPLVFQVGYYTEVAGLGRSPEDVVINGHIDVYNQCTDGGCFALNNFWRSLANLTVNVMGGDDCRSRAGQVWAVSQAAPLRRLKVNGPLLFMDKCSSPAYSSGGFLADSQTGSVLSGSQQQFLTRDSSIGAWSNGVWNQVFVGVEGAPRATFGDLLGYDEQGQPEYDDPYTVLPANPVSREKPYLYVDGTGSYNVFVPSPRTDSSGPTWTTEPTPGRAVPLTEFFLASPSDSVTAINKALAGGKNLLFTPGVYAVDATIEVDNPDTIVLGLGLSTLTAVGGAVPMSVSDVPGVGVAGLMFDAGPVNSPVLLRVGARRRRRAGGSGDGGSGDGGLTGRATNPACLHDVFFRVGGPHVGKATVALEVNSDNVILDDIWAWRADHGVPGSFGWAVNPAETGVIVNGDNVTATGLFVEHFQQHNVIWNGETGTTIFFQNEMPYDAPDQEAWQHDGVLGWAAYKVADRVRTHLLVGAGSYIYTNVEPSLHATRAFEVPRTPGVSLHNLVTVSLGAGTIDHIVNDTGPATTLDVRAQMLVCYP
jgi:hypothetical protein